MSEVFLLENHLEYLRRNFSILPTAYSSFDSNRATLLFFTLSSFDILGKLNEEIDEQKRHEIIEWIYRLQLTTKSGCNKECCGFRGSMSSAAPQSQSNNKEEWCRYDSAHLSQTYIALCLLLILGDDLKRIDRQAILYGVKACQLDDGSFCAQRETENGMRFIYCATAICYILNDFTAINMQKMLNFIRRSLNYDGAFGEGPLLESHGGSTYCAIASLALSGHLWDESVLNAKQVERLKRWALLKQSEGFHGRANKPDDSCYAFWIGATLKILDAYSLIDVKSLRCFLLSAQDDFIGGFSKYPGSTADATHTYFSIGAMSLMNEPGLSVMFAPLNISAHSHELLTRLTLHS